MPVLCVSTNRQRQLEMRHASQQAGSPRGSTFWPRREVARGSDAGIAESHRQDGNDAWVVEDILVDTHPRPQSFAAQIVERNSASVDLASGRLPGNQDARRRSCLQHGARFMREMRGTDRASAHLAQQLLEAASRLRFASHLLRGRPGSTASPQATPHFSRCRITASRGLLAAFGRFIDVLEVGDQIGAVLGVRHPVVGHRAAGHHRQRLGQKAVQRLVVPDDA